MLKAVSNSGGGGGGSSLTVGTTTISGGVSGNILYDNAGTLGEKGTTGTGLVVLQTAPTLITPALGVASGTSLALSGNLSAGSAGGAGNILGGTTTALSTYSGSSSSPRLQMQGLTAPNAGAAFSMWANNVGGPAIWMTSSRGTTVGDYTIAQAGDSMGSLIWEAADGTDFARAAQIIGVVQGTPANNSIPGAIQFLTTALAGTSPALRWTIETTGAFTGTSGTSVAIGGATIGSNALAVTGTASVSTRLLLGNGSSAAPAVSAIAFPTNGMSFESVGNGLIFTVGGNDYQYINSAGLSVTLRNNITMGWASGVPTGTLDTNLSRNAAGVIQFGTTAANASGAWLAAKGTLTGGTLGDQAQVFSVTATQPASPTGTQIGILETITGAGTASQANFARSTTYAAGYTGSSFNAAGRYVNLNAGALSSGLLVSLASTFPTASAVLVVDNGATTKDIFSLLDGGVVVFKVADGGEVSTQDIRVNNSKQIIFNGATTLDASGGTGTLLISTGTNQRLIFNGLTSASPALKRSTTTLQARLADDSAFTNIQGKLTTDANATTGLAAGVLAATTNATITITDASGQVYRIPCII